MTVKELIEELQNLPDDMQIILQKDAEGNGYSPLIGIDPDAVYIASSTWHGEVYDTSWTADEADLEDDEWEEIKNRKKSLILFPVN